MVQKVFCFDWKDSDLHLFNQFQFCKVFVGVSVGVDVIINLIFHW